MADPRQGRKSTARRARMIAEQDACAECGVPDSPANPLQVDHIIPLAKGGSDDDTNLQLLCRKHNLMKSDKIQDRRTWFDKQWLSSIA